VFDWLIELRYDENGDLSESKRIDEKLSLMIRESMQVTFLLHILARLDIRQLELDARAAVIE